MLMESLQQYWPWFASKLVLNDLTILWRLSNQTPANLHLLQPLIATTPFITLANQLFTCICVFRVYVMDVPHRHFSEVCTSMYALKFLRD